MLRFYNNNKSGVANIVVYLFWILASILFANKKKEEVCSFPSEFIDEVRKALLEQYKLLYFKYILRLKQTYMDIIIEVLPFFLAETCRHTFVVKLQKHDVPFEH